MKINKEWHGKNKMPKSPTLGERVAWHKKHQEYCQCRPIPYSLKEFIK